MSREAWMHLTVPRSTAPPGCRLVQRSFEKVRQVTQCSENNEERELLASQAAMIERLAVASVDEPADLASSGPGRLAGPRAVTYAVRRHVEDK